MTHNVKRIRLYQDASLPQRLYRKRHRRRVRAHLPLDLPPAFDGWLCNCGHWEESSFHCSYCHREPPWGCDCSDCYDRALERYADPDDIFFYFWESYPGDLLAGDDAFIANTDNPPPATPNPSPAD